MPCKYLKKNGFFFFVYLKNLFSEKFSLQYKHGDLDYDYSYYLLLLLSNTCLANRKIYSWYFHCDLEFIQLVHVMMDL